MEREASFSMAVSNFRPWRPLLPESISFPSLFSESAAMHLVSGITGPMLKVAAHPAPTLSREAKRRLTWITWHLSHDRVVSRTCWHFSIARQTFYRWWKRYDPHDLTTLEDRPSRPRKRRQRTWTTAEVVAVRRLREQHPGWGKLKLCVLLARAGLVLAASRVGRILRYLKRSRQLKEPPRNRTPFQRRQWTRPYATRKPPAYQPRQPGDLVQLDTLDLRLGRDVVKQFTAVDVVSRYAAVTVVSNATASLAVRALDAFARLPFRVKAVQVDGGSEFMADFEAACQARDLKLFVLPPHSPKLNGRVERLNRTCREECYDLTLANFTVKGLSAAAARWENTYNAVRPHQALGFLTPTEFLATTQQEDLSRT
jgi:putative transposase